jgi:hypothetical protein
MSGRHQTGTVCVPRSRTGRVVADQDGDAEAVLNVPCEPGGRARD